MHVRSGAGRGTFAAAVCAGAAALALLLGGCTKVASTGGEPAGAAAATSAPATAAVSTTATAEASGPPAPRHPWTIPHTLRIGDIQDINSLNPHLETSTSLGYMTNLTMAYLARYGPDNRPIPELATAIPTQANHLISRDGLTITFPLRKGVKWSDGAPFDADDVVFSFNTVNNPKNNEVGNDGFNLITKIDEPDKYTVVLHLKKPYSGFLPTFFGTAGANPCILPRHLLGSLPNINTTEYNSKPVGIGPYRFTAWVRGDHVEMEANPYYWRGTPKIKKIVYKFIPDYNTLLTQVRTGEVDLWPKVGLGFYDRVKTLPNVVTTHMPGYYFSHLDFNLSRPLFHDKAVREALRYALDRRTLRDKVQHGLGILQETTMTPISPLYDAFPLVPFDIGKANAILDGAGWKRGADGVRAKNGQRLAFTFALVTGQPGADQQVELIRSTWQQIGAQINVQHYTSALMFAPYSSGGIIYAGKFDVVFFSWGETPDGDVSNLYDCDQMPPHGQNVLRYCNRDVQTLLGREKAAYDESARKSILTATERILIGDVPQIVMWIREDVYTYNSDLRGWKPNAVSPFDDFLNVDI